MIILGLDPALGRTGWGVIKASGSSISYIASGAIITKPDEEMTVRLARIILEIECVILDFKPQMASMEEVFVNMNAASSLKLAHARGAIMSVVGKHGIPLKEFAPNKIKKTLVGAGKAEKSQVIYMVNLLMSNAKVTKSDEADAIAAAYTCFAFYGNNS
jgi:crossover junction endodeoxyribonuclease RuvC